MRKLIIVGGGPAGYVAAIRAAQLGVTPMLIERAQLGGTCLNRGCVPTKALLHASEAYAELPKLARMGVLAEGSFDYAKMQSYRDDTVSTLRSGIEQLLAANKVELVRGEALVTGAHSVQVGTENYEAEYILLATGSVSAVPPIPGVALENVVTSDALLTGESPLYKRLVIIGGGVIGVEMASVFASLGCKVEIVEALERLLPMMDRELSQSLAMSFKRRGIGLHLSARVSTIEKAAPLCVRFSDKSGEGLLPCDGVLIAVGRKPDTAKLFAEGAAPVMERGAVKVDETYVSSIPSILAAGDVNGRCQLAHAAEAQAIRAVEHLLGAVYTVDPTLVPACVYTSPEIACVGMTADELKAANIPARVGKYVMNGNAKALINGDERSFIKLVFHAETDALLGAQLLCARATDMIAELTTAIRCGLTGEALLAALRPHPSYAEAVTEAVESAYGHAIHSMPIRR